MTEWDFVVKLFEYLTTELRGEIMSVKTAVEAAATKISAVSDAVQAGIVGIRSDIQSLKDALVNATTEAEVSAILQPVLDKLDAAAAAVAALDAENGGAPPVPPEEPL